MKKNCMLVLALCACLAAFAQDPLTAGLDAYTKSDWSTAILSFRRAVSLPGAGSEPWYWLVMSELSAGEHETALSDIERFVVSFPADGRIPDVIYQKGRVLYLLGKYEDSIQTLYKFISSWPSHPMISSAYYWMGENLYATGRYDEARSIFTLILDSWPQSVKREAAWYRLAQIKESGREEELLKLLKMSHEESLKIIEDYQRREKTYEQAITAYQKRISDMIKDTRLGELEQQLGEEKLRNSGLLDKISVLEIKNAELAAALASLGAPLPASAIPDGLSEDINSPDPEKRRRALEELRNKAQALREMYDQIIDGGPK